jgi:predicted Rdx family selenoprotein
VKAELVRGDGGVFDVDADGVRIFSKHATGRYPDSDEIIEALKGMG